MLNQEVNSRGMIFTGYSKTEQLDILLRVRNFMSLFLFILAFQRKCSDSFARFVNLSVLVGDRVLDSKPNINGILVSHVFVPFSSEHLHVLRKEDPC